jgi:hypothetical protein
MSRQSSTRGFEPALDAALKGTPLCGRAALALDRPARRLGDGYREMG